MGQVRSGTKAGRLLPNVPQYHELMWPAMQATKELGGSAMVSEMNERIMASAGIIEEQQAGHMAKLAG